MTTKAFATYAVYADWNDDGDYSDTGENISAYVLEMDIQCGMAKPFDRMGRSNTLTLTLNNASKKFSPESGSALSAAPKGKSIKITMTYSATTVTLYVGRIVSMKPDVGAYGSRRAKILCDGFLRELQSDTVKLGTMTDIRSDTAITRVLNKCRVFPVGFRGWRIGVTGYSEIGTTSYLDTTSSFSSFDEGNHTFDVLGDNWKDEISSYTAIKSIVEAEWGRFFERNDGYVVFWNRHHKYTDLGTAVDGTITDADASDMDYTWGEDVVNAVDVRCRVRSTDTAVTVVAELDQDVKIPRARSGKPQPTVDLKLRDAGGTTIGVASLTQPVPYTDYTAFRNKDGADATTLISIYPTIVPGGVRWKLQNLTGLPITLQAGARQRGIRVVDYGQVTCHSEDATSITANKLSRAVTYDLFGVSDSEVAQRLADHIVMEQKTAAGKIETMTFSANRSSTMMGHARDRVIGDRLTLSETQTANSNQYFIIGRRDVIKEGKFHDVTFLLEPKPAVTGWLIGTVGYSEIDTTTYLVY